MRSTRTPILALTLLLLAGGSLAQETPDLSGVWRLDDANSETLRDKARDRALEQSTNPRAQQRWDRLRTRERRGLANAPFSRLTLIQDGDRLEIRFRDGHARSIYTDGRELDPDEARGIEGGSATWEGRRLVIENHTARGERVEQWELTDDGKRLFVTTEVQAGEPFGTLSFRRIYDLEPSPAEAPASEGQAEGDDRNEGEEDPESDDARR